jgi:protein-L-isoaspartate(D-aspartate) O-methyltransferase
MTGSANSDDDERMEFLLTLRRRGISDKAVLRAMDEVPRERFVEPALVDSSYADQALPIACGQTISQPYVVAYMTEQLNVRPHHRVLEIGTGSGYQAAVLGEMAREVWSIEVIPALARTAASALAGEGYSNIQLRIGNGALGWPDQAPFDAIIVTAAGPEIPPALIEQLGPGGRMIIPVGPHHLDQELVLVTKDPAGAVTRRGILPVAFVPLTGG